MEFNLHGGVARYAEIARYLGLSDGKDEAEASRALIDAIRQLEKRIGLPTSIAEMGISQNATVSMKHLPRLCRTPRWIMAFSLRCACQRVRSCSSYLPAPMRVSR